MVTPSSPPPPVFPVPPVLPVPPVFPVPPVLPLPPGLLAPGVRFMVAVDVVTPLLLIEVLLATAQLGQSTGGTVTAAPAVTRSICASLNRSAAEAAPMRRKPVAVPHSKAFMHMTPSIVPILR